MSNVVTFEPRSELTEDIVREAVLEAAEAVGIALVATSFTTRAEEGDGHIQLAA